MRVLIHDEVHELPEGTTVRDLLARLSLDVAVCAVAVNAEHVPRREHDRALQPDDRVDILAPMAGG